MRRRALLALLAAIATVMYAGCGSNVDSAQRRALAALGVALQTAPTPPAPPSRPCSNLRASLRPPAVMPAPGRMPAGSFMATLQHRGRLVAGVNQNYELFGYLDPSTGKIDGFEIDILRQIAQAIFGRQDALQFRALSVPQRIPSVKDGSVDIVADAFTITCARRQQVDFSTVYYDARQRVLVPSDSSARSLSDLGGKKVCATAGSVPYSKITHYPSHPIAVGVPQGSDCLVKLQEGNVDAISTDDSILVGFKAQDPFVKIVGPTLAQAPYGIAISQAHPDFVRFVNGVLARMRRDGTWHRLYEKWLGKYVSGPAPAPPTAQYDG